MKSMTTLILVMILESASLLLAQPVAASPGECTNPQSRPYSTCAGISQCWQLIAGGSYPWTSACGGNDACLGVGAPHIHGSPYGPFRTHEAACHWANQPCGMSYDCLEYYWWWFKVWWMTAGCEGPDCTVYFHTSCGC